MNGSAGGPEIRHNIHIGCSGYYYKHWMGLFYPETAKSYQFFTFYQKYFHTVEINSTFYHYPTEKQIQSWLNRSPDKFIFTIKAPRLITHMKRLNNCKDELSLFFRLIKPLEQEKKLGVILFQTPASLSFDIGLLDEFTDVLPPEYRYSFEFRNREYYNKDIYDVLSRRKMDFAYVSESTGKPFKDIVAPFKYFRMHGSGTRYSSNYSDDELHDLADKIIRSSNNGKNEVFVYFNNDYKAYAPKNALRLIEMLGL